MVPKVMGAFAYRYHVKFVPWYWLPLYWLYSYSLGKAYWLYYWLCHYTCRIEYEGPQTLQRERNYIYCLWHGNWSLCFSAFPKLSRQIWINHPYWYIRPVHIFLFLAGVKRIFYGSTGHSGREAATLAVEKIREGYSSMISPDGPDGPIHTVHKGVLHMSLQSQVPIVAISFSAKRAIRLNKWDKWKIPIPFLTSIQVKVSSPLNVTPDNFNDVKIEIKKLMM